MTTDPMQPPVTPPPIKAMDESLFNMWRCVVCIAHADGIVQPEERAYLEKIFQNLQRVHGMSPTQKVTLMADLETPQNLADLLPKVTDPQYRGQLLYFGTILAHADGTVTEDEERVLEMLRAQQMEDIDAEKLREEIRKDMEAHRADLEKELEEIQSAGDGGSPVVRTLRRMLEKLGFSE
jgi:tellurite resistance protein